MYLNSPVALMGLHSEMKTAREEGKKSVGTAHLSNFMAFVHPHIRMHAGNIKILFFLMSEKPG